MAFLGMEIPRAEPGMRTRRLLAFLIDMMVVLVLVFLVYSFTGEPDYFRVQAAMDAAQAAGGQDEELTSRMLWEFNHAYGMTLTIAFVYETVMLILTGGSTLGKLLLGLRILPQNPGRGGILNRLLLCLRSGLKMLSLYVLQGFPFLICSLSIFANRECRTGFDMAVKTNTVYYRKKGIP